MLDSMLSKQLSELSGKMGSRSVGTKLENVVKIECDVRCMITGPDTQGFRNVLG